MDSLLSVRSGFPQTVWIRAKTPRAIRPRAIHEGLTGYWFVGIGEHPARLLIRAAADPARARLRVEKILCRCALLYHAVWVLGIVSAFSDGTLQLSWFRAALCSSRFGLGY